MPSSSFLHLTGKDEVADALRGFLQHLFPGGLLAMSMRIMDASEPEIDWELEAEAARPEDGVVIRRWFRCQYEVDRRLQSTEDRYELLRDGQVIESETYVASPFLTRHTLDESLVMLREHGFVDARADSDFTFEPATNADTSFIVIGKKR